MIKYDAIKRKINDLISLMLTDGVQPSDLVDNIFSESYVQVRYVKINGYVVGEVIFEESVATKIVATTLRYFYNENRRVVRIEEESIGVRKTIWDRNYEEAQMINGIVNMMEKNYSTDQINKFVTTLPDNLKIKIESALLRKKAS